MNETFEIFGPKSLPVTSILVDFEASADKVRKVVLYHRKFFRFEHEVVVCRENPNVDGVQFFGGHPVGILWQWIMDFHVTFLCDLCPSKFALVYNCDGFIINPRMWTDEFLEWDYVGAPEVLGDWRWELDRMAAVGQVKAIKDRSVVGSGKFSLRSKKFMEAGRNFRPTHCRFYTNREDIYLCGEKREGMIAQGVRFCPVGLASRFSRTSDDGRSLKWCFGFDGMAEDVRELTKGVL